MTIKHTPEPWYLPPGDLIFVSKVGGKGYVAKMMPLDAPRDRKGLPTDISDEMCANARRIVACVNACEGMTTDELDTLPRGFKRLQAAYLDLYNERTTPAEKARAELLAALERAKSDIGKLPTPIVTDSAGRNHLVGSPMPLMRVIERIDAAIAKAKGGAT
ncbi:TPA: hypothetical protein P2N04_001059 [Aeromonas salmonicida]|uniref:Uncharacterized protein n=1 Tax=Aeromonas salmonicida subsp. salmonicida TaxID=29491 RepID=A0A0F6QDT6_AERSS|nr:hypothetical protein [Aeromonas salmonicida]AKD43425.1 hypothetical protein [Aeromonas salmonicida subsp. salmonicida]KIX25541.1 hypothetical protein TM02_08475 [Aeromonas salmonicida subsp. salmonicida]MBM9522646.1 hypothetical protein [Aeromonas salmonicida subsp. salmonicida]QWY91793.1 hypothetical protein [Aeromonas salmonicida subsp. salmonicida]HDN9804005.1 hypothetical protein [Aeromonas salmonicida]